MARAAGWRRVAAAWLVVGRLLTACDDGEEDTSCDGIAAHLEKICGEGIGSLQAEEFRYDCNTGEIYVPAELACLARARACDESSLQGCYHSRSRSCSATEPECDPGLQCDIAIEECVACFADVDCEDGRLCFAGFCLRDTPTNRALAQLSSGQFDGGAPSP